MRARKTDANHSAVVNHLRSIGWSVWDTSAVGRGFPDLVVSRLGHTVLVEVKAGKATTNELQRGFIDKWAGAVFIVRSPDDAERQLTLWLLSQVQWKQKS